MASKVHKVFRDLAIALEVTESDFLLLGDVGILTCEDFYYRLPGQVDLEDFLRDEVAPVACYKQGDEPLIKYRRVNEWANFKKSGDAAALRKLWESSKNMAKKELDKIVGDENYNAPTKITATVYQDMLDKAIDKGMPNLGPNLLPGRATLATVMANHAVGGQVKWLAWEIYVSFEEETRQDRLGLSRPAKSSVQRAKDGGLEIVQSAEEYHKKTINDIVEITDALETRAVAYCMAGLVGYETYKELASQLVAALRKQPPTAMRGPTVNELCLIDRLIHEEVYSQALQQKQGNMEAGLRWFCRAGRTHPYWSMADFVAESTPDRGKERSSLIPASEAGTSMKASGSARPQQDASKEAKCNVCGKPRAEHEKRRFCLSEGKPADKVRKQTLKQSSGYKGKGKGQNQWGKSQSGWGSSRGWNNWTGSGWSKDGWSKDKADKHDDEGADGKKKN